MRGIKSQSTKRLWARYWIWPIYDELLTPNQHRSRWRNLHRYWARRTIERGAV